MKMKNIVTMILAAGLIASAYSADQYWNGVDTTTGWNTTSNEWGATAGADVSQTWVNGNNAFIAGAGGPSTVNEDIVVNNLTYSGTGTSMNFTKNSLTANGIIDAGTKGFRFGSMDVNGTFSANGSGGWLIFASNGKMAGNITIGSSGYLQMTVGSLLTGNVELTPSGTLAMRWGAGQNQSMGTLSGNGILKNNAGGGHTAYDTTLSIAKLTLGTDGTIGEMTSVDGGQNNMYVLNLAVGTHQFDLSKSGTVLDNDYFDMAKGTFGVDVDGATIALVGTGDALALGDSFTLLSGSQITGTAIFDTSGVTFADAGYSFDTSNFNTTGAITVIPEPATISLIIALGTGFIALRRILI